MKISAGRAIVGLATVFDTPTRDGKKAWSAQHFDLVCELEMQVPLRLNHGPVFGNGRVVDSLGTVERFVAVDYPIPGLVDLGRGWRRRRFRRQHSPRYQKVVGLRILQPDLEFLRWYFVGRRGSGDYPRGQPDEESRVHRCSIARGWPRSSRALRHADREKPDRAAMNRVCGSISGSGSSHTAGCGFRPFRAGRDPRRN